MDLFINAKLYKSVFLDNVPKQSKITNINLFNNGGISGYVSQFKYFPYNIDRTRIKLEYFLCFRGIWYKFIITRYIYKLYLEMYKVINPDYNTSINNNITCDYD